MITPPPCSRKCGTIAREQKNALEKLMSIVSYQSSFVICLLLAPIHFLHINSITKSHYFEIIFVRSYEANLIFWSRLFFN